MPRSGSFPRLKPGVRPQAQNQGKDKTNALVLGRARRSPGHGRSRRSARINGHPAWVRTQRQWLRPPLGPQATAETSPALVPQTTVMAHGPRRCPDLTAGPRLMLVPRPRPGPRQRQWLRPPRGRPQRWCPRPPSWRTANAGAAADRPCPSPLRHPWSRRPQRVPTPTGVCGTMGEPQSTPGTRFRGVLSLWIPRPSRVASWGWKKKARKTLDG